MAESFLKRVENTVGKEKLLYTSNFSFSHSVFKRLVLQKCKNQGLLGKRVETLPNNRILDLSKLKIFAGGKLNVTQT